MSTATWVDGYSVRAGGRETEEAGRGVRGVVRGLSDPARAVRLASARAMVELAATAPYAEVNAGVRRLKQLAAAWSGEDREAKRVYRSVLRQIEDVSAESGPGTAYWFRS